MEKLILTKQIILYISENMETEFKDLAEILLKAVEGIPYDKQVELIASALEGERNKGYYTRDKHYRSQQGTKYVGNEFNPIKTIGRRESMEGEIRSRDY